MARRPTVVVGLLGPTLDQGKHASRWEKWRPSVALCQQDDMVVDRFEMLHQLRFVSLAKRIEEDVRHVSPETKVNLHQVEFDDPWDFEEVYGALHDFARDYPFDPDSEDYLVNITTGTHVAQICLYLLTESHRIPGNLLQLSPPPRRRQQAAGTYRIIDLDLSKYDSLHARFRRELLDETSLLKSGIDTRNKAFNRLIEQIERVATHSSAPILLTGPTGAGKSLLARRIYELKKTRRLLAGEFVEVNCATLRGDAAMSALFGHVKGAFTGAVKDRPGLLRAADGGLLFLDEVAELGVDEQAMLLRALEEKRFLPLGSDKEAESDFQLIAGTNRDLAAGVKEGRFREDLLSRIDLWTFRLPGLRERPEDIEPNLRYEFDQFTEKAGTAVTFNKEGRQHFLRFATSGRAEWKSNFRDLNGAVTRMATLAPGGRITLETVKEEIGRLRAMWAAPTSGPADDPVLETLGAEAADDLDLFDRAQLAEVIRVCRRSRSLSEAGRTLFAVSRKRKKVANDADRLRKYLARFGLDWRLVNEVAAAG